MVRVYINRHVVAANLKSGEHRPPITILTARGGGPMLGRRTDWHSPRDLLPDKPLSCGARVWIECDDAVAVEPCRLDDELAGADCLAGAQLVSDVVRGDAAGLRQTLVAST